MRDEGRTDSRVRSPWPTQESEKCLLKAFRSIAVNARTSQALFLATRKSFCEPSLKGSPLNELKDAVTFRPLSSSNRLSSLKVYTRCEDGRVSDLPSRMKVYSVNIRPCS